MCFSGSAAVPTLTYAFPLPFTPPPLFFSSSQGPTIGYTHSPIESLLHCTGGSGWDSMTRLLHACLLFQHLPPTEPTCYQLWKPAKQLCMPVQCVVILINNLEHFFQISSLAVKRLIVYGFQTKFKVAVFLKQVRVGSSCIIWQVL